MDDTQTDVPAIEGDAVEIKKLNRQFQELFKPANKLIPIADMEDELVAERDAALERLFKQAN